MLKYLLLIMLVGGAMVTSVGCEAEGGIDDDGASLEIEED